MTDCNVTELDKQGKPTGKKLYRAYVHCNKHGMFLRKEPKNDQYCTSIKLCSEHLEKLDRDDPTQKQRVDETEKVPHCPNKSRSLCKLVKEVKCRLSRVTSIIPMPIIP